MNQLIYSNLHREKLAELAKEARNKEHALQSDSLTRSDEAQKQQQQQQKSDGDHTLSHAVPDTSSTKPVHKPIVKSKEEEEILNDENIFHPRRQRHRERYQNKLSTSRSNSPYTRRQYTGDLASSMRKVDTNSMPMIQFGICKVCKNIINNEEKQLVPYSQQVAAAPTARSFEPQLSTRSVVSSADIVDDWFESASDVSGPREVLPWTVDNVTPQPTDRNPFQQSLFQPIKDNNTDTVLRRPPIAPSIVTDDETKTRRSTASRMSESDVFVRTPSPKNGPSSSARSIPSPVTKKHQTNTLAVINQPLSKDTAHFSPSQTLPTTERRMSGWGVREYSPNDSDEN